MNVRVLVVASEDAESEAAAEFRYLAEHRRLQIELCFRSSSWHTTSELASLSGVAGVDAVLVLTSGRVMVTAASLAMLYGTIADGHDVAMPVRLQDSGLLPEGGIDTLRQFEQIEAVCLEQAPVPIDGEIEVTPLSMWRPAAFESLLRSDRPDGGPTLPETFPSGGLRSARVGLYHEFIDYYGHRRTDVVPFIPRSARDVLEIGCGRGLTGELIQAEVGCRVTGVELNPVAAAEARSRLHEVLVGDVESLPLEAGFDAIVALELIEHLVDPLQFLRRMIGLLRPGGRLVLSTPNIAHHAIVSDLLAGRWDYLPTGTMCYTHLRFFTRSSLEQWLAMAGCRNFQIVPQSSSLPPELAVWAESNPDIGTRNFFVLVDV